MRFGKTEKISIEYLLIKLLIKKKALGITTLILTFLFTVNSKIAAIFIVMIRK